MTSDHVPRIETVVLAEDEVSKEVVRRYSIESFDDLRAVAVVSSEDTFWPYIRGLLDQCNAVLAKNGLPSADRNVSVSDDGSWSYDLPKLGENIPGATIRIAMGFSYVLERRRDFSDSWYAATIGWLCIQALAVQSNSITHALSFALQIGRKCSDWEWRRKHKPAIITGRKQRSTLKVRRDTQNAKMKSDVVIRRAAIQEILAKARLKSGAALEVKIKKQLEADTGKPVSLRTVRRDLQHLRGQP